MSVFLEPTIPPFPIHLAIYHPTLLRAKNGPIPNLHLFFVVVGLDIRLKNSSFARFLKFADRCREIAGSIFIGALSAGFAISSFVQVPRDSQAIPNPI